MLDLRLPSGLFFAITGLMLIVYSLIDNTPAPMTTANVNLYVGAIMTAFGAILLLLAKRGRKA
jgi:hypothetical protein